MHLAEKLENYDSTIQIEKEKRYDVTYISI